MPATKIQALNFLQNAKRRQGRGSSKYYSIGFCRILVKNDIVSIEDIVKEFPEVDLLGESQTLENEDEETKSILKEGRRRNNEEESKAIKPTKKEQP